MEEMKKKVGAIIKYCDSNYDALKDADALIVVTEWNEFRRPDFDRVKTAAEAARDLRRTQHLRPDS